MTTVPLAEVADINPRSPVVTPDEVVSFVGMAQLDALTAKTGNGESRKFSEVSKGYTVFADGDILLAKITPCFENNKIGQAQLGHKIGVGSTEFHVLRPGDRLNDRYLLHFLRQDSVRDRGEMRMTGSGGQRRVPVAFLKDLQIPLPPVEEQRRIAAILDCADALRGKRNRVDTEFDRLAEAAFESAFGACLLNPATTLGELAEIASGITKGRRTSGPTRAIPYLAVANVQAGHLNLEHLKTIEATEREIERYALVDGDIVLTEGGDPDKLGRGTVWREERPVCLHQNHIFRVRMRDGQLQPDYLSAYLASKPARSYFLRSAKQTTGIASINMTQLRATPVYVPPLSEQERFITRIREISALRRAAQIEAESLDDLFASLQSRAFSGQL